MSGGHLLIRPGSHAARLALRLPEWKIIRGVTAGWMCVAAFKRELIWGGGESGRHRGSRRGDAEHEDTKKGVSDTRFDRKV